MDTFVLISDRCDDQLIILYYSGVESRILNVLDEETGLGPWSDVESDGVSQQCNGEG